MNRELIKSNAFNLLDQYWHSPTNYGVDTIIDEWWERKQNLINIFRNHPNWDDDLCLIRLTEKQSRKLNIQKARESLFALTNRVTSFVYSADGNIAFKNGDPVRTHKREVMGFILPYMESSYFTPYITDEFYGFCKENLPDAHVGKGTKLTKAMRKIFTFYGITTDPDFEKLFAEFADALSPYEVTRYTIISLNPCDYLTMSFGNSWSSCHTIDKDNERGMPGGYEGIHASGTISYMLDDVSFVVYVVPDDSDVSEPYLIPKICREMFHYKDGFLIQGRLYPDYSDETAKSNLRATIQDIIASCTNNVNSWTFKPQTSGIDTRTHGTNYPDYVQFDYQCTASLIKPNSGFYDVSMDIGARPICVECGKRHDLREWLNCCNGPQRCEECGDLEYNLNTVHRRGEEIEVCDWCLERYYTLCDICGEYHLDDEITSTSDNYTVCQECFDEYFVYCEDCGEHVHRDNATMTADGSIVCDSCLENNYTHCSKCGKYYKDCDVQFVDGYGYICDECAQELKED